MLSTAKASELQKICSDTDSTQRRYFLMPQAKS